MIRDATMGDLDRIAALVRGSFNPALHPYMVYAQAGIGRFLAAFIAHPGAVTDRTLLVATDHAGEAVAFAEFRHGGGDALLSYICVSAEARGQGVATAMIAHFLRVSGPQRIDLDVFADNAAAISLYRGLGFQETSGTGWFARQLPPPSAKATPLTIDNLPVALAAFESHGFCELQLRWRGNDVKLGRIGETVFRCFDAAVFDDDDLLSRLRSIFPSAQEALFIAAESPDSASWLVNRTLRMTKVLGAER